MSDRIVYIYSNLCSVPWLGSAAAAVAPVSPPTPSHYHVLNRGCGETQLGWHGETYCLVGGYRAYGAVSLATPAKVEAEKPVPRRAPKRECALEESGEDLRCTRPKIQRLQHSSSLEIQGKVLGKTDSCFDFLFQL
uniref:DPEP2 neighbor protein n=1 Tax=Monodon monoceros TaxID=40151 RepID=A0A8C6C4A9_MONMO